MFSVSDPIQHFPNIPFNAHRSVTDQIRDTHIAGVDADIKIIFIFCCHAEKWIFDDSRRVVSHAEFQIQDMASVVTKQEIDASAGCLMPAFIFHKRVIRAQIHAHRFSAVWAVRHQFGWDPHAQVSVLRRNKASVFRDLIPLGKQHLSNDFFIVILFLAARLRALKQAVISCV